MKNGKEKVFVSLKKGIKEIKKIEAGEAKEQSADETIQQLIKERNSSNKHNARH
jgi:hypothetical protein